MNHLARWSSVYVYKVVKIFQHLFIDLTATSEWETFLNNTWLNIAVDYFRSRLVLFSYGYNEFNPNISSGDFQLFATQCCFENYDANHAPRFSALTYK